MLVCGPLFCQLWSAVSPKDRIVNPLSPQRLTQAEACALLRCSRTKFTELRKRENFPEPIRYPRPNGASGRRLYFDRAELLAWQDNQRAPRRSPGLDGESSDDILRNLGR